MAYGFAGTILAKFFGIAIQITISRMYGPRYFGMFVTGILLCQIMQVITTIGLQKGGMRFMSMAHTSGNYDKLTNVFYTGIFFPILTGIIMGILLYLSAPFIAVVCFQDQNMIEIIRLFALSILPLALLRIGADMSRAFKTVKYAELIENGLFSILHIGFFTGMHFMGFGFLSAVYSFTASSFVCAIVMLMVVYHQIQACNVKQRFGFSLKAWFLDHVNWKPILKYSFPLMPLGLIYIVDNSIDIVMLNILSSTREVGEYAAAARWMFVFVMIVRPMGLIFTPLIAGHHGTGRADIVHSLYETSTRWTFFMSLMVCIFIFLARHPLLLLFGEKFMVTGPTVLAILLVGFIPLSITSSAANLLWLRDRQYAELLLIGIRVLINLVLNFFLIMKFGAIGAAIATTISHCLIDMTRIYAVSRIFSIHPFNNLYVAPLVAGLIACIGGTLAQRTLSGSIQLNIVIALCATAFVAGAIVWQGLDHHDWELLKTIKEKLGLKSDPSENDVNAK